MKLKLVIITLMGFVVVSVSATEASQFSQFLHHSQVYVGVNNGGPYGGNTYGYNRYNNPPCHGPRYQPAPVPFYGPVLGPAFPPVPNYGYNPSVAPPNPGWDQFGNSGYSPNPFPPQESRLQYIPGHYEQRY